MIEHVTESEQPQARQQASFSGVIVQILLIDIIFSIDSILTAVGMTNGLEGAIYLIDYCCNPFSGNNDALC